MNEHVQTDFIEAILSKGEAVFLLNILIPDFTAPKFKLIEQIVESAVTKLVSRNLLVA